MIMKDQKFEFLSRLTYWFIIKPAYKTFHVDHGSILKFMADHIKQQLATSLTTRITLKSTSVST